MASLKEMSIREYVSQIDFKNDDWKLSKIKEDMRKFLGEEPGIEVLYKKDVMLNEVSGEAKEFVDAYFEIIREALEVGENVKLSGFGNFQLREKNQRPGRNPKTGEEIPISARRVVTFRPGQKLRARVEAYVEPGD